MYLKQKIVKLEEEEAARDIKESEEVVEFPGKKVLVSDALGKKPGEDGYTETFKTESKIDTSKSTFYTPLTKIEDPNTHEFFCV